MKINAPMLFHRLQQYFLIDYKHLTQNNLAKTPMFYNDFFDMNEHIVLVSAPDLEKCLRRVQHAILICTDPPERVPEELIGTNDLIILNDPMSDKLAFNILNHVLDYYQEFEHQLNEILYTRQSFQDMIEVITRVVELPISLSDSSFRFIAYSMNSGEYINEYVTPENELSEDAVRILQSNEDFRNLEKIPDAFVYTESAEPLVCRNIRHDGTYVGRLAVILPDSEADIEYCKAIFNFAAVYIELLYDQYSSFSNTSAEHRKVHDYMHLIFRRKPADRRGFLSLMNSIGIRETDDLAVIRLIPRGQNSMYNSSFTCEHLERKYPGCFCINIEESTIILASQTYYRGVTGKELIPELTREMMGKPYQTGVSRTFHALDIFEILFAAHNQAVYALEQAPDDGQPMCFFNDHALSYLLQHGAADTTFLQNAHPALITLKEHDDTYGTSYLETLRVYMDLNMNAVAAARQLYIHRSSFIGRWERLNRLVKMDLDDPRERLYVNLSFAIYL